MSTYSSVRSTVRASLCISSRVPLRVKKCSCHSCRSILVLRFFIGPWYDTPSALGVGVKTPAMAAAADEAADEAGAGVGAIAFS